MNEKQNKLILDILKSHDIYFLDEDAGYHLILDKDKKEVQVFVDEDGDIIFKGEQIG